MHKHIRSHYTFRFNNVNYGCNFNYMAVILTMLYKDAIAVVNMTERFKIRMEKSLKSSTSGIKPLCC